MMTSKFPHFQIVTLFAVSIVSFAAGWWLKPTHDERQAWPPLARKRAVALEPHREAPTLTTKVETEKQTPAAHKTQEGDEKSELTKLRDLSVTAPEQALELGVRLASRAAERDCIRAVRLLVKTAPARAAELASQLATAGVGLNCLEHVANDWTRADPQAAEAWAAKYTGPGQNGFRLRVIGGAAEQLGEVPDAREVKRLALELPKILTSGSEDGDWGFASRRATDLLADKLQAVAGPAETLTWLDSIPSNAVANRHQEVLKAWITKEPELASQWVNQLPAGAKRDRHTLTIINTIRADDPIAAQKWASTLADEKTKNEVLARLASGSQ